MAELPLCYQACNAKAPGETFGTTDPAGSCAYWADPVYDTNKCGPSEPAAGVASHAGLAAECSGDFCASLP